MVQCGLYTVCPLILSWVLQSISFKEISGHCLLVLVEPLFSWRRILTYAFSVVNIRRLLFTIRILLFRIFIIIVFTIWLSVSGTLSIQNNWGGVISPLDGTTLVDWIHFWTPFALLDLHWSTFYDDYDNFWN